MAEVVETSEVVAERPVVERPLVEREREELIAGRPGLSWSAIFAGAATASALWIFLYALGAAIGLSSINPHRMSLRPSGIFAGIWAVIVPLFALFVGGWVAGRGAGILGRSRGALHGLVVWSLTTLLGGALVMTALSALVRQMASVGEAMVSAGGEAVAGEGREPGAAAAFLGLDANEALRPVNDRLQAAGRPPIPPSALDNTVKSAVQSALASGQFDENQVARSVSADTGLPPAEAQQVADRLQSQYQQRTADLQGRAQAAAQGAKTGALVAAHKSGRAFWGLFIALLLDLIAALAGGAAGSAIFPHRPRRERVATTTTTRAPVTTRPPREVYP